MFIPKLFVMKRALLLIVTLVLSASCNDVKKATPSTENEKTAVEEKRPKENIYRLHLYGVFEQSNRISFWFLEDQTSAFNSEQYLIKDVRGNTAAQQITFELPKDIYLEKFRLRPAIGKEIKNIRLDSLVVTYNNDRFTVTPENFVTYLVANQYVTMTPGSPILSFQEKEVNGALIYDPFIISSPDLNAQLISL